MSVGNLVLPHKIYIKQLQIWTSDENVANSHHFRNSTARGNYRFLCIFPIHEYSSLSNPWHCLLISDCLTLYQIKVYLQLFLQPSTVFLSFITSKIPKTKATHPLAQKSNLSSHHQPFDIKQERFNKECWVVDEYQNKWMAFIKIIESVKKKDSIVYSLLWI